MSQLFLIPCIILVVAQFVLPRRFAFVPLLAAACILPNAPVFDIGVIFTITKLLILAGLLRAALEGRLFWPPRHPLDVLVAVWACWAILSGFAHDPKDHNPIMVRLTLVYENAGTYLYARSFLRSQDDFLRFTKWLALLMVALAAVMLVEKQTGRNVPWAITTGKVVKPEVREGSVRAAGPFMHPALAGTAGASCLVLLALLRRRSPRLALAGAAACGGIVFCSASSGPLLTLFFGLAGLGLWRWRKSIGSIRTCVIVGIIGLQFLMKAPVWYLMSRVDLVAGSSGYHRAELITQALNHLDRWWLVGTDYTRDWMVYGIGWSQDAVDMTNHYLKMGVIGGLPLMLCFIAILIKAFQLLGRRMRALRMSRDPAEFMLWSAGAALFAHCVAWTSISYFDQSYVFFCLIVGAVPGLCAAPMRRQVGVASTATAVGTFSTERHESGHPAGTLWSALGPPPN